MVLLGVNIDHIASLRQARYRGIPAAGVAGIGVGEPDPVRGAHEAELGGADIITVHLREDRRHIQDHDVVRLREFCRVRLNLEMGATEEMLKIAAGLQPEMVTLVPEGRAEVTTEGGLGLAGSEKRWRDVVARLKEAAANAAGGVTVSAFIDPDPRQVEGAKAAGFDACEIHTGPFAAAFARSGGDPALGTLAAEAAKVQEAGHQARALGMRFNAGHALNYQNVAAVARMAGVAELHIGHAIISRAVYVGLRAAVAEMKAAMRVGAA